MLFKCMECGQEFGQITGKHVKRHGYATVKEYLEKSDIKKCLLSGSILASKIIQKIGARIE